MAAPFRPAIPGTLPAAPNADHCRAERDDARRLRCYDDAFGAPVALTQGTSAAANERATAPAASLQATPPPPAHDAPPQATHPKLLTAKVSALRFSKHGAFVATLDNGQTWAQFVAEGKARIAVGDTVTVWPGWAGSYNLKTPADWITKVHPVAADASGD